LLYALKLNKRLWLAHFALGVLRYKTEKIMKQHISTSCRRHAPILTPNLRLGFTSP
jgi:hypothetical protein